MRFLLFGKDEFYYASGGAHDCMGGGDCIDVLIGVAKAADVEWWHIYDTKLKKIVTGTRYQAHGACDLTAFID